MELDLFPGSYELIDAVILECDGREECPVPVTRLEDRIQWSRNELECAINLLTRDGLLSWADGTHAADRGSVRITPIGLDLVASR
ncbi:MAG: hypothetical protein GEU90_11265 [Gemmatimonas sp.]|nr:hypothetical protein [Gemmatimonas sp.]